MGGYEEAHGPENNDAGGIENGETPATTKSGRAVRRSRIIRDEEDFKKELINANLLVRARKRLKEGWSNFESNNPPIYVSQ